MESEKEFSDIDWNEVVSDETTYFLFPDKILSSSDYLDVKNIEEIGDLESCILLKTSGSSGIEKWVIHSKSNLLEHAGLVNSHLLVTDADVFGLVLPTHHVGGLGVIARAYLSGAGLVRMMEKWSASRCIDFIKAHKVSVLSLVPTQLVDLITVGFSCPESMRVAVVGGGALDEEVLNEAINLGWPVQLSYGMTETGSQIATGGNSDYMKLINGWQVQLSTEGVLEVRGDCLLEAYLEKNHSGDYRLVDPKIDGWFKTSDRVEICENNREIGIKFLGRNDQVVKVLGELVNVSILEERLSNFLKDEVYIITVNNVRRGVDLVPVIVNSSLIGAINNIKWTGLHRLEEAIVLDDFPKNEMGKLLRLKLREMVESIVFPSD